MAELIPEFSSCFIALLAVVVMGWRWCARSSEARRVKNLKNSPTMLTSPLPPARQPPAGFLDRDLELGVALPEEPPPRFEADVPPPAFEHVAGAVQGAGRNGMDAMRGSRLGVESQGVVLAETVGVPSPAYTPGRA